MYKFKVKSGSKMKMMIQGVKTKSLEDKNRVISTKFFFFFPYRERYLKKWLRRIIIIIFVKRSIKKREKCFLFFLFFCARNVKVVEILCVYILYVIMYKFKVKSGSKMKVMIQGIKTKSLEDKNRVISTKFFFFFPYRERYLKKWLEDEL